MKEKQLKIIVETVELDLALEKAKRLVELLKEAQTIVNSLSHKELES